MAKNWYGLRQQNNGSVTTFNGHNRDVIHRFETKAERDQWASRYAGCHPMTRREAERFARDHHGANLSEYESPVCGLDEDSDGVFCGELRPTFTP